MAYASNTRTALAGTGLGQRLNRWAAEFGAWNARRKVYRTTYNELSMLSDRELNDLGIARADIGRVALEATEGTGGTAGR